MGQYRTSRSTFIPEKSDLFTMAITNQSLKAWEPFYDRVPMNFDLQNSDVDDEHPEWRVHWVFGVAMLRTVGHVLAKVDSLTSTRHKKVIDDYWKKWKAKKDQNWVQPTPSR